MPKSETSTVLVALCGRSPAVITETVWALAHEHPPLIPDRVVIITTREGREAIRRELLEDGIWRRLRETLHATPNKLIFGKCENREKPTSEGAKRARKRPHQSGRQAAPCADANGD